MVRWDPEAVITLILSSIDETNDLFFLLSRAFSLTSDCIKTADGNGENIAHIFQQTFYFSKMFRPVRVSGKILGQCLINAYYFLHGYRLS